MAIPKKKSKKFFGFGSKKKQQQAEEKIYTFNILDEEGKPIKVINVKEKDLTLEQLNMLYNQFIQSFNGLPDKVRLSFIQYIQSANAPEEKSN